MRTDGLYRTPVNEKEMPYRVCGRFDVLAEARPEDGSEWGLLLQWNDRDDRQHQWIMPRRLLAGEAMEVRSRLSAHGLDVSATQGARQALVQFLAAVRVKARVRTVPRTGWYQPSSGRPVFVLPTQSISSTAGEPTEEIVKLDLDPPPAIYGERGTLNEWKARVAALCIGNSRLMFGVATAFAPTLLHLIGDEGGGINLRGESSKGKTTIIDAAASVWGPPSKTGPGSFVRQWRTTANALESTAAAHNHALLPMDEMGQADPKELGETMYMLANGSGKDRARAGGGNRVATTWLTLVLSSSEESTASLAAQAGRRSKAGQEVRLLDVPALVAGGHGCFEQLHGQGAGAAFARAVRQGVVAQHGTAAPAFLAWLVDQLRQNGDFAAQVIEPECREWLGINMPKGADGQVVRAGRRLAIIAVAGELATEAGVTGWPPGAAFDALGKVFRDWMVERGGSGSREDHHLFAAVRRFIGAHGAARFSIVRQADPHAQAEAPPDANERTMLRVGWRWEEPAPAAADSQPGDGLAGAPAWIYGMLPDQFEIEIASKVGMEARDCLARLGNAGMIRSEMASGERRWSYKAKRIPGAGRPRLIVFKPGLLEGGTDQ